MPVNVPKNASQLKVDTVLRQLGSHLKKGLSTQEAEARLESFGKNELPELPATPLWKLFLDQFNDGLVRILLAAAGISFAMALMEGNAHGFVDPLVILLILAANAFVGVWQENRAESAIEALKSFVPKIASVVRDGHLINIDVTNLVPGDVVEVAVGNRVPADMRVCELLSTTLRADQAILNGESVEAMKVAEELEGGSRKNAERFPANMIFSGTAIVYGKARCVVVRTGANTEIGSIERDVREQDDVKTPLQIKLDEFGELLSRVIGYICIAVFAINLGRWYLTHQPREGATAFERFIAPFVQCLKVAVALAVAAIPEGLPAVVTTCLALGTRRMAKHNALVRDLPSVETLGRCTVICSDKTGTLTTNMMSVVNLFTLDGEQRVRSYFVDDSKYTPVENAVRHRGVVVKRELQQNPALLALAQVASLCNDSSLTRNEQTGNVEKIGEATEAALKTLVEKLGTVNPTNVRQVSDEFEAAFLKQATLEFTRERKSMSVLCREGASKREMLLIKGAPEAVLSRCNTVLLSNGKALKLTAALRKMILDEVATMSGNERALRCLGFARRPVASGEKLALGDPRKFSEIEADSEFLGVVGMLDPPRMEVKDAIEKCSTAGIRVVVITGDNKATAEAICRRIGIFKAGDNVSEMSFTGAEFDEMTLTQKRRCVMNARLFSRTDPSHKMALVQLLQSQKLICAMTGDGVNDAPALKKADIGIAMGSGTEVAKAASKMVLADDNFVSVVKAVREGRAIYNNTKQFIRYLISSNIGEVVCILVTGILGIPDALIPVQLLWVNLVTDGLPATALGFNPPDPDIMEQPPREVDEPIVNGWLFFRYMIIGAYVGLATVGGFVWWFLTNGFTIGDLMGYASCTNMLDTKCATLHNAETARAVALSILVVVEMLNALNGLSENQSIVTVRPTTNPWLLVAIVSSMLLHFAIMYVPQLASIFSIAPLGVDPALVSQASPWTILVPTDFADWKIVLVFSIPVIFIDELLKLASRLQVQSIKKRQ